MKKKDDSQYEALRLAINEKNPKNLYIFHGEEKYLLETYLKKLREALLSGGFEEFNYKRFEGRGLTAQTLVDAVDALPVFGERTLVEVHDFDIWKCGEETRLRLMDIFEDLPEYVCLVFVYDTIEYKPDGRQKLAQSLKKYGSVVDFALQDQTKLLKWIQAHVAALGKTMDPKAAEYLAFITGGLMTTLSGEIEKVCAYAKGDAVTKKDIDAVVTPVLDAVSFKLTDAVAKGDYNESAKLLDELLRMREPPHKLIFGISLKIRQLLAARVCLDSGLGENTLKTMCGIRYDFQARALIQSAGRTTLSRCRRAARLCAQTAFEMNSGSEPEAALTELLIKLSVSEV